MKLNYALYNLNPPPYKVATNMFTTVNLYTKYSDRQIEDDFPYRPSARSSLRSSLEPPVV